MICLFVILTISISQTLQNKYDFSKILSNYAEGKPVNFSELLANVQSKIKSISIFPNALKRMKENGEGPERDNHGVPIKKNDELNYSAAIYNVMNFIIGGYVQSTDKAPTKILTFVNVTGYLYKITDSSKEDAEAENLRTCNAVAKTLTFATEISGNDENISSSNTGFGRRIKRRKSKSKVSTRKKSTKKTSTRKVKVKRRS